MPVPDGFLALLLELRLYSLMRFYIKSLRGNLIKSVVARVSKAGGERKFWLPSWLLEVIASHFGVT
jgi:hypothetical protein